MKSMIDLDKIRAAAEAIQPYVYKTPLKPSYFFSEFTGFDVHMKMENWQPTGSFKVRGALNFLHSMSQHDRIEGVVAWSAGNHGLGVAYAAKVFDVPATIFVPKTTPQSKVKKFRHFPVELQFAPTYEDCEREGRAFAQEQGRTIVHPYDDWRTVAGQGTTGLEICESMPEIDAILVPVGGGGLISGIAIAAKTLDPDIRIVAVQTANSPSLLKSLQDQKCYEEFPVEHSIAEGLAGGIGRIVYDLAQRYIDEILLVDEEYLKTTIRRIVENEQMLVEPSGAVTLAALEQVECVPRGSRITAILSGGNLDTSLLRNILK